MDKESGSMHEKLDFKMDLPVSSFLVKSSCDSQDFSKWLSSGDMTAKHSVKCESLAAEDITSIIKQICSNFDISGKFQNININKHVPQLVLIILLYAINSHRMCR